MPGDYTVEEVVPTGWVQISAPGTIHLVCSDSTGNDFVNQPELCINGTKIRDCDDSPVSGVTINLFNDTHTLINTTTTDAYGGYIFCHLMPGDYTVEEVVPTGWVQISAPGTIHLVCSDSTGNDFVNQPELCINGYKLHENGSVLEGWNISLYNDTHTLINTTTTDASGYYIFCHLMPGTYYVNETMQQGWTNITPLPIEVILVCDSATDQNFTNRPDTCSETAWAKSDEYSNENWNYTESDNWGWTNGLLTEGNYVFDLWAGAGQNNISKGTLVGMVYVNYTGGCVNVTYVTFAGYYIGETHLWVGYTPLPKVYRKGIFIGYTSAPGQFPYGGGSVMDTSWTWESCMEDPSVEFTGEIYVAAHAVVWGPCGTL